MWIIKEILLPMLWPPRAIRELRNWHRDITAKRSTGWNGLSSLCAIFLTPIVLFGAILCLAFWLALGYGLVYLVQHVSVTLH